MVGALRESIWVQEFDFLYPYWFVLLQLSQLS
jgi:hypothetical protein